MADEEKRLDQLLEKAKSSGKITIAEVQEASERRAKNYMDKRSNLYANAALSAYSSRVKTSSSYIQLGNSMVNSINIS